ncbi:MAG TPA: PDDEXK nuclease domain-containing protein [Desulfobacterales bacterium]|nr:PDDEXK nuclease domain-containing protein [Desulfobacterales bacterium]
MKATTEKAFEAYIQETVKQLPQSVKGVFKDSYIFDFLDLPVPHKEKELQQALVDSLKDFILELGIGFTFNCSNLKKSCNRVYAFAKDVLTTERNIALSDRLENTMDYLVSFLKI